MKLPIFCLLALAATSLAAPVANVAELRAAAAAATPGTVIDLAAATFALTEPLDLKSGTTLKGAGIGKTIITNAPEWQANPATLPDPETNHEKFDRTGYLIRLAKDAPDFTIAHLTLTGPQMHGAIFGWFNKNVHLHDLRIADFMYAGVRTYGLSHAKIHDCTFVDAGQRWDKGQPGVKGGITGGGIFSIWMGDTEISNCRFLDTKPAPNEEYYGIKGRNAVRCRIHHNTIETGFSIELPFEGDEDVEIDHNFLHSVISIPKHAGGHISKSGSTFHIHHNVFRESYSIEFPRNCVEIDHNLFDFDAQQDGGNLIAAFGGVPAPGPASFHHNYVSNPGRGVLWLEAPFAGLDVHHNHIIARTTKKPRTEGLFDVNGKSDFKTHRYTDNLIECEGTPRPLFRIDAMAGATIENNKLVNLTDTARYENKPTGQPIGPGELKFACGVNGELLVDGWKTSKTPAK